MDFFKSKEERQNKKQEKRDAEINAFLDYYNLGDIDERDHENLLDIFRYSRGLGLSDFGNILSGSEKSLLEQITTINMIAKDQNFLIIKQLDRLNKNLESISSKLDEMNSKK